MHARIRRAALMVLAVLQLEACLKKYYPPPSEADGIVMTTTMDGGRPVTVTMK